MHHATARPTRPDRPASWSALRTKGETPTEIAGCVDARCASTSCRCVPQRTDLIDTCRHRRRRRRHVQHLDRRGDRGRRLRRAASPSTATARCRRSRGSADVLEALGVAIDLPPDGRRRALHRRGRLRLHVRAAPTTRRCATRAPVRRELGIRTVFNLLGPLTNPAAVPTQVIGVPRPDLVDTFAQVAGGARHRAHGRRARRRRHRRAVAGRRVA